MKDEQTQQNRGGFESLPTLSLDIVRRHVPLMRRLLRALVEDAVFEPRKPSLRAQGWKYGARSEQLYVEMVNHMEMADGSFNEAFGAMNETQTRAIAETMEVTLAALCGEQKFNPLSAAFAQHPERLGTTMSRYNEVAMRVFDRVIHNIAIDLGDVLGRRVPRKGVIPDSF